MKRYLRLLQAELNKGVSRREMSRAMALHPQSIGDYLTEGTEPRLAALEKMAAYFGESVTALLAEEGSIAVDPEGQEILAALDALDSKQKKRVLAFIASIAKEKP